MKLLLSKGTQNYVVMLAFRKESDGKFKTGTTASMLTAVYSRADQGNNPATIIPLIAGTRGTWTSGGFVEKDAVNAKGDYEFGIPNAALLAGSDWVTIDFQDAASNDVAALKLEIQLYDLEDEILQDVTFPLAATGALDTTPYASINEGNEYFSGRLNTSAWDAATDTDRAKALKSATRAIDRLRFVGKRLVTDQGSEFPRYGQSSVPNDIKAATCEIALALLDDADIDLEIRNIGAINNQLSTVKSSYDKDFVLSHIRNGIVSSEAWMLLLPYLVDPLSVKLVRG